MILQGPGLGSLSVNAVVLRREVASDGTVMTALNFRGSSPSVEDHLQRVVIRALEWRGRPAALVVHENPLFLATMARDLVAIGYEPLVAVTRFEVIRRLRDRDANLRAVVAELSAHAPSSTDMFEFVKEAFPRVRRVAVAKGAGDKELARALVLAHVDDAVDLPWTRVMLKRALGDSPGSSGAGQALRATHSSSPP